MNFPNIDTYIDVGSSTYRKLTITRSTFDDPQLIDLTKRTCAFSSSSFAGPLLVLPKIADTGDHTYSSGGFLYILNADTTMIKKHKTNSQFGRIVNFGLLLNEIILIVYEHNKVELVSLNRPTEVYNLPKNLTNNHILYAHPFLHGLLLINLNYELCFIDKLDTFIDNQSSEEISGSMVNSLPLSMEIIKLLPFFDRISKSVGGIILTEEFIKINADEFRYKLLLLLVTESSIRTHVVEELSGDQEFITHIKRSKKPNITISGNDFIAVVTRNSESLKSKLMIYDGLCNLVKYFHMNSLLDGNFDSEFIAFEFFGIPPNAPVSLCLWFTEHIVFIPILSKEAYFTSYTYFARMVSNEAWGSIIPEPDGVRFIGLDSIQFFSFVDITTKLVFGSKSEHEASMFYSAGNDSLLLSKLKAQNAEKIDEIADLLIEAAVEEWNVERQKSLLTLGTNLALSCKDTLTPERTDTLRLLRILNHLRFQCHLPITIDQLELVRIPHICNMLTNRGLFRDAIHILRLFEIPKKNELLNNILLELCKQKILFASETITTEQIPMFIANLKDIKNSLSRSESFACKSEFFLKLSEFAEKRKFTDICVKLLDEEESLEFKIKQRLHQLSLLDYNSPEFLDLFGKCLAESANEHHPDLFAQVAHTLFRKHDLLTEEQVLQILKKAPLSPLISYIQKTILASIPIHAQHEDEETLALHDLQWLQRLLIVLGLTSKTVDITMEFAWNLNVNDDISHNLTIDSEEILKKASLTSKDISYCEKILELNEICKKLKILPTASPCEIVYTLFKTSGTLLENEAEKVKKITNLQKLLFQSSRLRGLIDGGSLSDVINTLDRGVNIKSEWVVQWVQEKHGNEQCVPFISYIEDHLVAALWYFRVNKPDGAFQRLEKAGSINEDFLFRIPTVYQGKIQKLIEAGQLRLR
eukprot:TRINITY_DN624_c0_g1_i1.p1 TRINITY_DN624_c0_g1~~TRINITY_DN624_c0_g1_i1.p1  ORF type:complete len:927 (-),score=191.52 TRINITY_DN624_c0_g1_i1:222-3002(-)